jgi:hypothetical protein
MPHKKHTLSSEKAKAALAQRTGKAAFVKMRLVLSNCLYRAGICARTTGNASVCINYITVIAFLDGFHWTCFCTRTARETCI